MQDRFRFRVWLKYSQKLVYVNKQEEDLYSFLENVNDRYIPMQCTGLKDKNGKLIYEGDIVVENWHGYIISWNRASFDILDILSKKCYTISALCSEKSEVIGNIYENKELLND